MSYHLKMAALELRIARMMHEGYSRGAIKRELRLSRVYYPYYVVARKLTVLRRPHNAFAKWVNVKRR